MHPQINFPKIKTTQPPNFLKNPNPLQTQSQYLYEFYVLNSVYNKTFQYKVLGLSFDKIPAAMWILPSGWMKINVSGKIYRQTELKEIITDYVLLNDPTPYEVERVIYMAEGIGNNVLNPISRIETMQIPLSNIMASMKSRNIITRERGMIGFITPEVTKDSDGSLPYDAKEHQRVREEYQRQYSLDGTSGHVAFPKVPLKWVPMSFDIKQLGLLEGTEDDFCQLISAWRHDRDIYPSLKGATFENKLQGLKSTIQNGIIPLANKLMTQLTKHLLEEKNGEKIICSFDHLPCMKEDLLLEAQGRLNIIQGLTIALRDNVINHETYALEADLELTGTQQMPVVIPPRF